MTGTKHKTAARKYHVCIHNRLTYKSLTDTEAILLEYIERNPGLTRSAINGNNRGEAGFYNAAFRKLRLLNLLKTRNDLRDMRISLYYVNDDVAKHLECETDTIVLSTAKMLETLDVEVMT